jgi:hypothetical protein
MPVMKQAATAGDYFSRLLDEFAWVLESGGSEAAEGPTTFDFLAAALNVSPTGPGDRLNEGLRNPARLSATLIPRSV